MLVVIADIIASRSVDDRAPFQRHLKALLERVSRTSRGSLLSPYTLTLGDEFQAVYGACDTLFADLQRITLAIHPVQLRFALGYGTLSTDLNRAAALEMDGPAFNSARTLMNRLKPTNRGALQIVGDALSDPELLNASLELYARSLSRQSRTNLTIFDRLLADAPTRAIADELGITPRAVNKAIATHALDALVDLARAATETLARDLRPLGEGGAG